MNLTARLLWGGVLGPLLFVAVFLIEGSMRAGYDPVRLQVSYLSLGERGWVQTASFLASGGLILGFAIGLRRAIGRGIGAFGGPVTVGLVGLGLILAGLFPTVPAFGFPPGTPDGFPVDIPPAAYLHVVGALGFFGGMAVACLVFARRFRRLDRTAWATYSAASFILVFAFFGASSSDPAGTPFVPELVGLLQRISIIAGLLWMVLLSLSLIRAVANPTHGVRVAPP